MSPQRNDATDIAVVEALLRDASFANASAGNLYFAEFPLDMLDMIMYNYHLVKGILMMAQIPHVLQEI